MSLKRDDISLNALLFNDQEEAKSNKFSSDSMRNWVIRVADEPVYLFQDTMIQLDVLLILSSDKITIDWFRA